MSNTHFLRFDLLLGTAMLLASVTPAQTGSCVSGFALTKRVSAGIFACQLGKPLQFAYRSTVPRLVVVSAMQVCTAYSRSTSTMALEIYDHDATNNRPGRSLAKGAWQIAGGAPIAFQGCNLDKAVALIPGTIYWFVWTAPCGATPPHRGTSTTTGRPLMTRSPSGTWRRHSSLPNLKYRLFCNLLDQKGIATVGGGCGPGVASFFTNQVPEVGNSYFKLEGTNLPASAQALLYVGVQKNWTSISLAGHGAPGCFLHTDLIISISGKSGTANPATAASARGHLAYAAPIPNSAALKGAYVRCQIAAADASSTNPLQAVFTNGLQLTVQ